MTEPSTETRSWQVSGMYCGWCHLLIDDAVERLPGVLESRTSRRRALTAVTFDPNVCDEAQVVAAIEAAGYGAVEAPETAPKLRGFRGRGRG